MLSIETRSALQLNELLADRSTQSHDSGLTPDQAVAAIEAGLDASLSTPATAPAGSLPADGAVIVFDVVPVASWASPGVTYRVERQGREFRFQNVRTGSATFDRAWAVARSTWRAA